jgi:hypothetical protein
MGGHDDGLPQRQGPDWARVFRVWGKNNPCSNHALESIRADADYLQLDGKTYFFLETAF